MLKQAKGLTRLSLDDVSHHCALDRFFSNNKANPCLSRWARAIKQR